MSPVAMIRRKGLHFDKPKRARFTYEQLLELDGLFKPNDIEDRLPMSTNDLLSKQLHGSLSGVFYSLEGDHYIDLQTLDAQLRALLTPVKRGRGKKSEKP